MIVHYNITHYTNLFFVSNRRPKHNPRDEVESSIPQTMQLFNRMHKKSPSNITSSSGGRAAGNKWGMAGQAPAGNEAKKVS